MKNTTVHVERALLAQGWARDVAIHADAAGTITAIDLNVTAPGAIAGIAVAGMANAHSHAHQRAMAGLAEWRRPGDDDFWSWRQTMYAFAANMDPRHLEAIAAQAYVDVIKAGYTAIGEFHYLHHRRDGEPYDDIAEMSASLVRAADSAGIALTLTPVYYRTAGFDGSPARGGQIRFANDFDRFARLLEACARLLEDKPTARLAVAAHSLRAVPAKELPALRKLADSIDATAPLHIHVAEQTGEVDDCLVATGKRPVALLADTVDLSPRWCLVHATHMDDAEIRRVADSGAIVCLCPTTEANLGDGVFPARDYLGRGGAIAIGSDSHIEATVAGELRLLEYAQRLVHRRRNVLAGKAGSTGRRLFDAACHGGARAIGQPIGEIAVGRRCDIVILDAAHADFCGRDGDALIDTWVFRGDSTHVRHVFVAGRQVVRDFRHVGEAAIADAYRQAMHSLAGEAS